MANITQLIQDMSRVGSAPVYTSGLSITDTYFVQNDGKMFLHFKKSGAGICNVTVVTPGSVGGLAIADLVVAVPASTGDVMVGPFDPTLYNDPSTGMLSFTLSEITGLSVARMHIP